jgi:hypothetical protein
MPEGVVISIADTVPAGWTATMVADILRNNGIQLAQLGPNLKVKVQTTNPSGLAGSASGIQADGNYSTYKATMYLDARSTAIFPVRPDFTIAHEYGHFWANTWMFLKHQGSITDFMVQRGIAGDSRIGSSYAWTPSEIIADDYRLLFATQLAQDQASPINRDIPDPRSVVGLRDWFLNSWA